MKSISRWDPEVDAAYIKLSRFLPYVSEEVASGIIIDYDKKDRIVGIEILDFCKRFSSPRMANALKRELSKVWRIDQELGLIKKSESRTRRVRKPLSV